MTDASERRSPTRLRSDELSHQVPHAHPVPVVDDDDAGPPFIPFDREYFERHKAELKRSALLGRVALVFSIFVLLALNLYFTRQSTIDVVENINWSRMGQGAMEDDVTVQLKALDTRLAAIEAQNKAMLEGMGRSVPAHAEPERTAPTVMVSSK